MRVVRSIRMAALTVALAAAAALMTAAPAGAATIVYGCGYNICAVSPDGSHHRLITHDGREHRGYGGPRITGRVLSFAYRGVPYLADPQARHRRALRYPKHVFGIPKAPVLSHDGRHALFVQSLLDISRLCDIATSPGARPHCPDFVPADRGSWAWGPHDTLITTEAFDGQTYDGDDICIMANRHRCKKQLVRLDDGRVFWRAPELSPNGRWLAAGVYESAGRGRGYHIVLFDVRRRRLVRDITKGPDDSVPSWSPDSRSVVFERDFYPTHGKSITSICTASIRGGHVRCPVKKVVGKQLSPPTWGP